MLAVKFSGLFLVPLKMPHGITPDCQIIISVSLNWNDVSNVEQKTGGNYDLLPALMLWSVAIDIYV